MQAAAVIGKRIAIFRGNDGRELLREALTLRGAMVGEGEAFPGMYLAINPGGITTPLIGTATTDPAFGLPAHWIDDRQKEAAQMAGFTVVDSETVVATHLSHLMQVQAAKLLSRTETQQLVEHVGKLAPKLIEEVVPKMVSIATFQKVLQLLLEESVHIRDRQKTAQDRREFARVLVEDAAGNQATVYGPTTKRLRKTDPGPNNGTPAVDQAVIKAAWEGRESDLRSIKYDQQPVLRGQLLTAAGQPIRDAFVRVTITRDARNSPPFERESLTTNSEGRFRWRMPKGSSSRRIQLAYYQRVRDDQPVVIKTLRLQVAAGLEALGIKEGVQKRDAYYEPCTYLGRHYDVTPLTGLKGSR